MRPLWTGAKPALRDTVFLPYIQVQRAVRDERWKLISYPKLGYSQLFDLQTDPSETRSVYDDPAHAAHIARFTTAMKTWPKKSRRHPRAQRRQHPAPADRSHRKQRKTDQWQPEWIVKKYFDQAT